jgi:hypothetical protein
VDESLDPAVNARREVIARRAVIAGILGSLPICKLADAAARPPAAPAVSPPPPAPSPYAAAAAELSSTYALVSGALAAMYNIQAYLGVLAANARQDQSTGNLDDLNDALKQIDLQIANLQSEVEKMKQLGLKISQLQALVGNIAASPQDCNRLTGQLYTAGYLGDAQIAAMSRGQFQWSGAEIQSAVMRGSAAADVFMAPISAQLRAQHEFLNAPGTLPQRAP